MDRRGQHHRQLLSRLPLRSACFLAAGCLAAAGVVRAQQPASSPAPSVAVPPPGPATPDANGQRKRVADRLIERRQRELSAGDQEAQRRIDALPPEEREAFKRNLRLWRQLTPEERETMRKEVNDRTREEVERAYQQSGLHLDKDQREVFGLRYRQERRKLERELQEKTEAERARRLPGMVDGLKKEFADKSGPAPSSPIVPTPVARATPSVSVPAAAPAP